MWHTISDMAPAEDNPSLLNVCHHEPAIHRWQSSWYSDKVWRRFCTTSPGPWWSFRFALTAQQAHSIQIRLKTWYNHKNQPDRPVPARSASPPMRPFLFSANSSFSGSGPPGYLANSHTLCCAPGPLARPPAKRDPWRETRLKEIVSLGLCKQSNK